MLRLQGIAVSPGIVIGEIFVLDVDGLNVPQRRIMRKAIESELARLDAAFESAREELEANKRAVSSELGRQYGAIFDAHLQMLRDPGLRKEIEQGIREKFYCAEYAVHLTLERFANVFRSLDNSYIAQRANDLYDLEKRLLRPLLGQRRDEMARLSSPVLVFARALTPGDTVNLDRRFVKGLVTETGAGGSHTAIVAEGMEIPAVLGVGPFLSEVNTGDTAIIDGDQGIVIVRPDKATLDRYRKAVEAHRTAVAALESLRDLPSETADGQRVWLYGNIEFPHEAAHCKDRGSDGIGLYRTEFLYMGAEKEPDEEAQFAAYAEVVRAMNGLPVTIRTLDLGADKLIGLESADGERNPFLGLRSIRLSLRNLPMFRTQLRAILRASALGDVRVMFPLIATVLEIRQAKMVLADVMEDLQENSIAFNRDLPVGMMVEVPSAVMMIDHFAPEVDFLSIGTNDLIQYTLAVDRSNKDVASLYTASDPAVLKLIDLAVKAADRSQTPISLCGQMSGSPTYTMLLLGLGLRHLSVTPSAIPEIKRIVRAVTIDQCEAVAQRALTLENARDVRNYLREELKRSVPVL